MGHHHFRLAGKLFRIWEEKISDPGANPPESPNHTKPYQSNQTKPATVTSFPLHFSQIVLEVVKLRTLKISAKDHNSMIAHRILQIFVGLKWLVQIQGEWLRFRIKWGQQTPSNLWIDIDWIKQRENIQEIQEYDQGSTVRPENDQGSG